MASHAGFPRADQHLVIVCIVSNNFGGIIGGRVMGGLLSAGGSVTMGMVADMFDKDDQQCAVLWSSIFSCLGTVPGGITGGPVQQYLGFRLIFWIQLILGAFTQLLHLLVAKETRAAILIDHAAKRLRSYGNPNVQGPDDKKKLEGKVSLEGDWYETISTLPDAHFRAICPIPFTTKRFRRCPHLFLLREL